MASSWAALTTEVGAAETAVGAVGTAVEAVGTAVEAVGTAVEAEADEQVGSRDEAFEIFAEIQGSPRTLLRLVRLDEPGTRP